MPKLKVKGKTKKFKYTEEGMKKYKKALAKTSGSDRVPSETQAQHKNYGKVDKDRGYMAMQKVHGGVTKTIKKKDGSWYGKEKGRPSGMTRRKKSKSKGY